jgi:hypothetical protein
MKLIFHISASMAAALFHSGSWSSIGLPQTLTRQYSSWRLELVDLGTLATLVVPCQHISYLLAFRLNLTCANRIFIVELQWNPGVESQAIARAIRLGQKSEVCVTRYMIKGTVEEVCHSQILSCRYILTAIRKWCLSNDSKSSWPL